MLQTQPNFEALKRAFYNAFINSRDADMRILMESLSGEFLNGFHQRKKRFTTEFNEWLDRLDIRMSSKLIEILITAKRDVPNWMKQSQYIIDYNKHGMLDLIKMIKKH
jgi:hypothetical protein